MDPVLSIIFGANFVGALFVAREKPFIANVIWSITNPIMIIYNYDTLGAIEQAYMYIGFLSLALYGVILHLWRKRHGQIHMD